MELTQEQINKLWYIELLQENYKTPEQEIAIELEEKEQRKRRYTEARKKASLRNSEKRTFLNHLGMHIDNNSITEDMEEREVELTFNRS